MIAFEQKKTDDGGGKASFSLFLHSDMRTGYTATPVACGWAGARQGRFAKHLGRSSKAKNLKNAKKVNVMDVPTYRRTNGWTDR